MMLFDFSGVCHYREALGRTAMDVCLLLYSSPGPFDMFQPAHSICVNIEGYHYQHLLNFVDVLCACCSWPTIYTAPQGEVLLI